MEGNKTPSAEELAALFRRKMAEIGSAFDCLQAESAEKDKEIRRMSDNCTKVVHDAEIWKQKYNSVLADLARVTAERDEALKDCSGYCATCAFAEDCAKHDNNDAAPPVWYYGDCDNWMWRGPQKEGSLDALN